MLGIHLLGIVILLIIVKSCLFNKNTEKDKKRLLILTFVLLVLLLGCRNAQYDYGSDLNNYYRTFKRAIESVNLDAFLESSSMEKGYLYLNWGIARVIKWPQFIVFFQAAFCCGITLRYIYRYSTDIMFSILGFLSLGLFQFFLTGFRQSIAIAICLIAFEMAEKRKPIKFLLCVLLAMAIHQTAIIYILTYFLVNIRISKLFVVLDIGIVGVVSQFVPKLIELGNEVFEKEYEGTFVGNSTGGLISVFIGIMIIFIMVYQMKNIWLNYGESGLFYKKDCAEVGKYYQNYKMFHVLILGVCVYAMRYQALVLERISLYFTPTMFILLPEVINKGFVCRERKAVYVLFEVGMLFLIYWRFGNMPYVLYWN